MNPMHAYNPVLKMTKGGEAVSRFELNSSVKQVSRGKSLLERKSNRQVSFWVRKLRFKSYNLEQTFHSTGCGKCGNIRKTQKCGNPDHPKHRKAEIKKKRDSYIRLGLFLNAEKIKHFKSANRSYLIFTELNRYKG